MTKASVKRNALISVPCFVFLMFVIPLEIMQGWSAETQYFANFTLQMLRFGFVVFFAFGVVIPILVSFGRQIDLIDHRRNPNKETQLMQSFIITDWMERR